METKSLCVHEGVEIFLTKNFKFNFICEGCNITFDNFESCTEHINKIKKRFFDIDVDVILDYTKKAKIIRISKDAAIFNIVHVVLVNNNIEYHGRIMDTINKERFHIHVEINDVRRSYLCFVDNEESTQSLKDVEFAREKARQILIKNNEVLTKYF